jgi:hypothetical protein
VEKIYLSKITTMLLLLIAVVAFLAGAYASPLVNNAFTSEGAVLKSSNSLSGRFTLVVNPLVKTEKFLLDTQLGRMWQIVKAGESNEKPSIWHRIAIVDDNRIPAAVDKNKLSIKLTNEKISKDKLSKVKIYDEKVISKNTPDDKATIEIITNGRISKERVPKENYINERSLGSERDKSIKEQALSTHTL